jgi:hypothetical protein
MAYGVTVGVRELIKRADISGDASDLEKEIDRLVYQLYSLPRGD